MIIKNEALEARLRLTGTDGEYIANPSFSAGEVQIWVDSELDSNGDPVWNNVTNLPQQIGQSEYFLFTLTAEETNHDWITIRFVAADLSWDSMEAAVGTYVDEIPSIVIGTPGDIPTRVNGQKLSVFNQEEVTLAVPLFDIDRQPVDLSGETLWFGVWGRSKEVLFTGTATGTATGFNVELPKITKQQTTLTWALRRSVDGEVFGEGPFEITNRPFDAA